MSETKHTIHINPNTQNAFITPPAPDDYLHELATQLSMNILFGALSTLPKDDLLIALEASREREKKAYLEQCANMLDFSNPKTPNMIMQKTMIEGLSKEILSDIWSHIDAAALNSPDAHSSHH